MADYRLIHCLIWDDDWFAELKDDEKVFFLYLITNRRSSAAGIYVLPDKVAAVESGVKLSRLFDIWKAFEKRGKVFREGNVVWIVKMRKYQNTGSIKVERKIEKDVNSIPDCKLKRDYLSFYTVSIPYQYHIDTRAEDEARVSLRSETESETDTETETDKQNESADLPEGKPANDPPRLPVSEETWNSIWQTMSSIPGWPTDESRARKKAAVVLPEYPQLDVLQVTRDMKLWHLRPDRERMKPSLQRWMNFLKFAEERRFKQEMAVSVPTPPNGNGVSREQADLRAIIRRQHEQGIWQKRPDDVRSELLRRAGAETIEEVLNATVGN